ncbi:glycine cleavage system protein R [Pseudohongiella acticola]|jgi:glycine cleavage system regulatory protein|uniref:Glycine cleavage system transcriptional repressor n=1 Tax=Pseudohongiella acticola TaxID=1524254 RepID=A0A1E8CLW5_9GAMM|nr:ACT domain-containing protein [Pseudohongiella acticola]OFE13404.1 glycine cleavage system protein R [Pseudohongiella acticola]|tara:strand:+ start:520 stop:1038 length:519 start_codon:yes stop_codon:yes gene_type:complete
MKTYLVLTLIGNDQPGLVESLAQIVAQHQGNWLESNMSRLAGKFAGILRVSVDEDKSDALVSALDALSPRLKLIVEHSAQPEADQPQRSLRLSLVGNDRPGIIRDISGALARQKVNVDDLDTECVPAPMSSDILFRAEAVLHIPADLDIEALRAELERLADDLIVDLNLIAD